MNPNELAIPHLTCKEIDVRFDMAWDTLDLAFSELKPIAFGQAWRDCPQENLRPAVARVARADDSLLIYAILEDEHIFNPVTEHNEPAFTKGDVFEIFLRPDQQSAYFEFHVNPQNQKFQLRIPSAEEFHKDRGGCGMPHDWLIRDWQFESRVKLEPEHARWRVLVQIPLSRIVERGSASPGTTMRFSFSRYDYPAPGQEPVLSSTSPHRQLNFHRQQEWGLLTL
ncbi:MAG: carbohydrate-binding family 9-like protein [Verrucomicrobiota bacterium]